MFEILRNRSFRDLFGAQVVALVGTGLASVALALPAYDLAGAQAGSVLGTALAIKMVVYITLSPVAGAWQRLERRSVASCPWSCWGSAAPGSPIWPRPLHRRRR